MAVVAMRAPDDTHRLCEEAEGAPLTRGGGRAGSPLRGPLCRRYVFRRTDYLHHVARWMHGGCR